MATSLLLACGLNEQQLLPYTHLSEESGVDGSFLISSILGQRLRVANSGTILVCLHQNYDHYCKAGMRLGYNLQMSQTKNLRVIDVLTEISVDFSNSKWTTSSNLVQLLWDEIQIQSNKLLASKSLITLIIDDLSVLVNLGANFNEILRFCNRLRKWTEEREPHVVAIVTKLNVSDAFEKISSQMDDLCDIHVVVERLRSGNFKEVDGKIVVKRSTGGDSLDFQRNEKVILYKVLERNIKIFNPGEVGIKI